MISISKKLDKYWCTINSIKNKVSTTAQLIVKGDIDDFKIL